MKGTSINKIPFVQNDGLKLTISFNENVITEADGQKTYEYETAVLVVTDNYEKVRDAILEQCEGVSFSEARTLARKALNIEVTPEMQKEDDIYDLQQRIGGLDDKLVEALERLIATNGVTKEDKAYAQERLALRDELGKLIQTEEGDGSDMNPYKWTEGKAVVTGKWYKTPSNYIWEAIKDGVPASETDTEYFDVVGL